MHLVGFIIRIYHDARSRERQDQFVPHCEQDLCAVKSQTLTAAAHNNNNNNNNNNNIYLTAIGFSPGGSRF